MGTPFESVFEAFLSKTNDFDRSLVSDEMLEKDMTQLMLSALPFFVLPRVNLNTLDMENECFNEDLSLTEIQIIACLMKREWYKRFIADTDVLMQKFGETDFEFKSQANHLKALIAGEENVLDKEISSLISNYSRFPNGKVFDYSRLAGKK